MTRKMRLPTGKPVVKSRLAPLKTHSRKRKTEQLHRYCSGVLKYLREFLKLPFHVVLSRIAAIRSMQISKEYTMAIPQLSAEERQAALEGAGKLLFFGFQHL
ncbi:MAG: hypothetical protein KH142_03145, partial [Slackia piriformis]|nr:hypothetical protein [Slackia piriformis]